MPRLFTGLEIPAEIGQTLSSLRGGLPGARWIDPENYHVTLRFIGDIDGVAAREIASILFRVNRKPFEVKLQSLSSFGGRKPRAVVASVVPSRPLIELQAELERLMQRFGLDPEGRKFTRMSRWRGRAMLPIRTARISFRAADIFPPGWLRARHLYCSCPRAPPA